MSCGEGCTGGLSEVEALTVVDVVMAVWSLLRSLESCPPPTALLAYSVTGGDGVSVVTSAVKIGVFKRACRRYYCVDAGSYEVYLESRGCRADNADGFGEMWWHPRRLCVCGLSAGWVRSGRGRWRLLLRLIRLLRSILLLWRWRMVVLWRLRVLLIGCRFLMRVLFLCRLVMVESRSVRRR